MRSGAFFCVRDLSAAQARDGAGCRVSIAGKPAPTGIGCSTGLVGDGLPGMGRVAESASPASRLPQVMGAAQARDGAGCRVSIAGKPAPTDIGCSAGLMGDCLPGMGRVQSQHRRQAGSHRYWVQCRPCGSWLASDGEGAGSASPAAGSLRYWVQCRPCGSWLARDGAGCRIIIAGKPAPTDSGCSAGLVGAGLPAMGQVAGSASPAAGSHR